MTSTGCEPARQQERPKVNEASLPREPVSRQLAQVCGSLLCGISLLTVTSWASGWPLIAQWGANYVPIAPSTALAIAVLGAGLFAWSRWPAYPRARQFTACAAVLGSGLAVLLLMPYLGGFNLDWERFLVPAPGSFEEIPVGRMSPVTAIAVLLAGLALLASVTVSTALRTGPSLIASLATCVTAIGSAVLLGYAYRMPLLYGGTIIPVALPTALAVLLLGLGLLAAGNRDAWPTRTMLGPSVQARLLRAFLPVTLVVVLCENWLQTALLPDYAANPALWSSIAALISLATMGGTVTLIARGIGGTIERAEASLRASEEKYRRYVDHSPLGIFVADAAGRCVEVNPSACRMTGFSAEDLSHMSIAELLAPDALEDGLRQFQELKDADHVACEVRFRRKDGGVFDAEVNAAKLSSDRFIALCHDITQRKRLQDEVALRERQLESFFLGATAGLALLDKDLRFIQINGTLAEMNGLSIEDHLGRTIGEVVPRLGPTVEPLFQKVLTTGEPILNVEVSGETRSQPGIQRYWMESFFPITGTDGSPNAVGAIVVETTEQKRAEERLRIEKARAQEYLNIAGVILLALDGNGNITLLNRKGYEVLEYPEGSLTGRNWLETCLPARERNRLWPLFRQLSAGNIQAGEHLENMVLTRSGNERLVAWQNTAIFDETGTLVCTLSSGEDITERRRREDELVKVSLAAQAANRAKSEFLANMSHEIRTPMTAILGFSDLLASPNLPDQEQRQFLAGIQRNGKALLELISDILDLSRIEADRLTLEAVECSLQQIVDDVLSVVQLRAEAKGLALEVDYAFPLPATIHTDPVRLRQILTNLIGNAVRFTERGAVRMTVRCTREIDGFGHMQFAISDTGIGIAADKIGELFEPFTQVDGSATRRYGGTGLGLAISRRLAKALGGDVEVTSQLGKGSTFTLTIDAGSLNGVRMLQSPQVPSIAAEELSSTEHEVPLHGRVLLAEDVPDSYVVLRQILQRMNLEPEIAEDGRLACEMAERSKAEGKPFDLILMDIQMPKLNGYGATRWLREHGWKGPIVALTAHALVGDHAKCLEAGCDDYIAKPITAKGLRDVLARYLGQTAVAGACPRGAPDTAQESAGLLQSGILDPRKVAALVDAFRRELPTRAERVEQAFQEPNRTLLFELVHQLKGSAGIYGFDNITETARTICDHLRADDELEELQATVSELVTLCKQAASHKPGTPSDQQAHP